MVDTRAIVNEITREIEYIVTVPADKELTPVEQQTALATSGQHILHCVGELLEQQNNLMDRLYHSEKERFDLRG